MLTAESSFQKMTHIALALHDKQGAYWPYVVATLTSVFSHTQSVLHVHLLHDDTLRDDARQAIEVLCKKYQHSLSFHAVALPESAKVIDFGKFSPAAAYRLMIPQLLQHLNLVIYLDADIIFNQVDIVDLVTAIEKDPEQRPIAAVHDSLFTSNASQKRELQHIGVPAQEYVNSGVLGIRPPRITQDLLDELQRFVIAYPRAVHHDQDLINVFFRGQIWLLPERFNFQVNLSLGRCFEDLGTYSNKVLHYSGKTKPLSGALSSVDVFFWRYTQHIADIHRYIPAPVRYLQKMRDKPSAARFVSTHEGPAQALPPVQWLTTSATSSHLKFVAKDPRVSLCADMTWEDSQTAVREGKARGTVWSAKGLQVNDYHLLSRMHEWWEYHPRCVLRDAKGKPLLVAQLGVSEEALDEILANAPGNGDAAWDVHGHTSTKVQLAPLLIVTATRESAERFFTHTALGQSITQLRERGIQVKVHAAANNAKPIGTVYNAAILERWANHIIVFVHDDVRFDDIYLAHRLHEALQHYDIVGVAGNRRRYFGQPAWHRPRFLKHDGPKDDLLGSVFHDTLDMPHARRKMNELSRFGDSPGSAQLLDGVFIAVRGKTLLKKEVRFDASLGFHFYDLDFCRTATQAGLHLGVWPIALTHKSVGGYESRGWRAAYQKYLGKWGEQAPHPNE
jgi:lipopolysaccharide biosynthesis glycosyltransferase